MNVKKILRKNLVNIPGWRTSRKIFLIESDDWGSIRMPDLETINRLESKGLDLHANHFTRLDSLEKEQDLLDLFSILRNYKDKEGRFPVITANCLVANPDFLQIERSDFRRYHFETIEETYKKNSERKNVLSIWEEEGINNRMLWPQFHGREHFNFQYWLKVLQSGDEKELLAFKNRALLGIGNDKNTRSSNSYMAAFDYEKEKEFSSFEKVISQGIILFNDIFGFKPKSFVAPCSIRSDRLDPILAENGIKYHQVGQQQLPQYENYRIKHRFWGAKNQYNQIYWRRNSSFEPARDPSFDWIGNVMHDAKIAFRWGKPLVVSSHRVNYTSGISVENKLNTLRLLDRLLQKLVSTYPDIEFFTSDQLGDFIVETTR